jgi:hypothetical protein
MKTKTEKLLKLMNTVAWIVFIGLLIVAGAVITAYLVSIQHPQAATNLYKGMDLYAYRQFSLIHYTVITGYTAIMYIAEAYAAFLMTRLLSGINISRPFNAGVAQLLQKISYVIFFVWLAAMVHNIHVAILEQTNGLVATYISGEFIFLAGIAYVFAQLFKRGVEFQTENDLTI